MRFAAAPQSEDLGYFQRFVESVCFTVGLNYGLGFVSELFVFFSVAAASILCVSLFGRDGTRNRF